ncbi:MAG: penicillin-binding protein 2 [Candidatus Omnitrophica bacterium]|nr:penicillin-binding protein 2 [Candidatus Omnitrophota bacterium]
MNSQRYSLRLGFIFFSIFLLLGMFTIKLSLIQLFRSSYLADKADKQHNHVVDLEPIRGKICDREMRELARNLAAYSLFANPKAMTNEQKSLAAQKVSRVLGVSSEALLRKMEKSKSFVWLARKIPQEAYEKLKADRISGLAFIRESKRSYPNGEMAAHVIGFANIDNVGLQGVELEYDKYLRGTKGVAQFLRDARQRDLMIEKDFIAPKDGSDVILTIDETIQFIAEKALEKAFVKYNAASASVIVLDPKTGEVLAFANRPTFRPDAPDRSPAENRTNRAVAFVYEPGSVFKIVTATAALEEGVTNEQEVFFCENGKYRVGNHILKDAHPKGRLTFRQVIEESSNIGTVKVAQRLGPDKVYEYAHRFRFGLKTNIGMTGEVGGLLKATSRWSKTSMAAIPIGQEVTVTPIQLAVAIAAIANDGVIMKPYFVKQVKAANGMVIAENKPQVVSRVMSVETARRVRSILQGVIDEGTAQMAKIKDVTAGGKTGTAQKVVNGTYSHSQFVASFIGFAPVEGSRLAVVVNVDEPHPAYYGGVVAGPVFKEVVENTLKYLASRKGQRDAF